MTLQNAFEGLATEAKQDLANTALGSLLTELGQKLEASDISALATAAKQDSAKTVLDTISATLTAIDGHVDGLEGKDYSTQTTLAAVLAKIIAAPATEAKQDTIITALGTIDGHVDGLEGKDYATQTTLAAVLTELGQKLEPSDLSALATAAKQDTAKTVLDTISTTLTAIDGHVDGLEAKDYATQTTLAAILAKILAAPATEAKQDTIITSLSTIDGHVDGLEGKDFATQTTLAAVLAKIIAAPATEAKQDTIITALGTIDGHVDGLEGKDYATQTTLAAVLAKIIAAPATEAKQDALAVLVGEVSSTPTANTLLARLKNIEGYVDGLEGKDYSTQTTLAAVLAKIIAAPATEAKQDALAVLVGEVSSTPTTNTLLARLKNIEGYVDGLEGFVDGIEGKLDTINTSLGTIDTRVDGLEGYLDGVEGKLDTLHTDLTAGGSHVLLDVRTSGGLSVTKLLDVDETEDAVKTSAGQVYGWYIYNAGAAVVYLKFYNDTVANVVVGTTAPLMTVPIPAGAAANVLNDIGIPFSNAITVAATTGLADNNTGAPATDQVVANIFYA